MGPECSFADELGGCPDEAMTEPRGALTPPQRTRRQITGELLDPKMSLKEEASCEGMDRLKARAGDDGQRARASEGLEGSHPAPEGKRVEEDVTRDCRSSRTASSSSSATPMPLLP